MADSYCLIRKDRQGFYVPVIGFTSVFNDSPPILGHHQRYIDLLDALEHAMRNETDSGIIIHEECYDEEPATIKKTSFGHYPGCPEPYNNQQQQLDCECHQIESDWAKDYTEIAL